MDVLDRLVLDDAVDVVGLAATSRPVDEMMVRSAMAQLPTAQPAPPYRRRLERFLAEREARRGHTAPLEALLRTDWEQGGDIVPWLRVLLAQGRLEEAAAFAAGARRSGPPRAELDEVYGQALKDRRLRSLARFVEAPTAARWRRLLTGVDPSERYARTRQLVRLLAEVGLGADDVAAALAACPVTCELMGVPPEDRTAMAEAVEVHFLTADERARLVAALARSAWSRGDTAAVEAMVRLAYGSDEPKRVLPRRLVALFERIDHDLVETELLSRAR